MTYILLFLEGIITFLSPCLLPMLPLYLSYFAAGEQNRRRTLGNALGFVLGFSCVFVALGAFAGTLGWLLQQYSVVVNIVTGLIVVALGLHFLGLLKLSFLFRLKRPQASTQQLRFGSSVLFGLAFSAGWSPCIGPMLGTALMQASQRGGALDGAIMLLLFSLGMALPLVACALLMDQLKGALAFLRRNQRAIHVVSGMLLVLIGVAMALGWMDYLLRLFL